MNAKLILAGIIGFILSFILIKKGVERQKLLGDF